MLGVVKCVGLGVAHVMVFSCYPNSYNYLQDNSTFG